MPRNLGILTGVCLGSLTLASGVLAQQGPYPYPYQPPGGYQPAPGAPPPAAAPAPGPAPGGYQPPAAAPGGYPPPAAGPQPYPAPGQQPGAQPAPPGPYAPPTYGPPGATPPGGAPGPGASAAAGASFGGGADFSMGGRGPSLYGDNRGPATDAGEAQPTDDEETARRRESLKIQNSLEAATGLLRVYHAGSGAPGTFRFSLSASYFAGSGFLCPKCVDLETGGPATKEDEAEHVAGRVGVSATPASFLEAYLGIHTSASTNNRERPQLLQVLGDTNLGLKAFMPHEPDSVFSAGGGLELWMLNGTGTVGVDAMSFGLRGMATADFSNRKRVEDRIPLRTHLNLGYLFDNSGNLVEEIEKDTGESISRIERFGLGINRVDRARLGIGLEIPLDRWNIFTEWSADVPVNRQNHVCNLDTRSTGDSCLGEAAGFSTTPSRWSVGVRAHPFLEGFSLFTAIDVGTGATSEFIEEVAPEMPWNLHFGLAYAVDTKPRVEVQRVEVQRVVRGETAKPPTFIQGTVVDRALGTPVPDAIVRFEGRALTGMVTMADGTFRSGDLQPGTYTFSVGAPGYRDAQCSATLPFAGMPGQPVGAPLMDPYGGPGYAAPGAAPGQPYGGGPGMPPGPYGMAQQPGAPPANPLPGVPSATVTCEVDALPKVGNVDGQLRDAESGSAVGGGSVKITDKLGRSLSLTADAGGAFRFENVPAGAVTITAEGPSYLRSVVELAVKAQGSVTADIQLNKRPRQANVVVTKKEIKLKKAVHFQTDSAEILPDSMGIIEEIADVLRQNPEISGIEIQGHTDDSGTPPYNLRLSGDRANAVREALVKNGVEASRLTSRGYGQEKPLVPNTSEASRARNRRVQLMIQNQNQK